MFNFLVTANGTAWETDQLMRIDASRFKESSGIEGALVTLDKPETLQRLEDIDSLLMYELCADSSHKDSVRLGRIHAIRRSGHELIFQFNETGRLPRALITEFADRIGINQFEFNRTHWAIKDGELPSILRDSAVRVRYEVVLSFAGENRPYVSSVAAHLRSKAVDVFYDADEEATLWGKNLVDHLDAVYQNARFCVMFISKFYAEKMWTNHERKSALARAVSQRSEYILPVRFDDTPIPGLPHTVGLVYAARVSEARLAELVLAKLGRGHVPPG
ncbi:MAG: TIR domain-containing protein [Phycisphaerales bacterium]|nr:TIR domain-containing protein [Phycisphaerales bacterium]